MKLDDNASFKQAYTLLKTNAEALQNQSEPDIDALMDRVEESIHAYKICQKRLKSIQKALANSLEEAEKITEADD